MLVFSVRPSLMRLLNAVTPRKVDERLSSVRVDSSLRCWAIFKD